MFPKRNLDDKHPPEIELFTKLHQRTTLDSDRSIILNRKDEDKSDGIICNALEDVDILIRDYETGATYLISSYDR